MNSRTDGGNLFVLLDGLPEQTTPVLRKMYLVNACLIFVMGIVALGSLTLRRRTASSPTSA